MTELRRIIDGDGNEFERVLLRSAIDDAPTSRARTQTLVALGIGGSVVAGSTAAAAATAAAAKGTTAAIVKTGSGLVIAKWVGIAAVGGLGTWGIVETVSSPPPSAQSPAASAPLQPASNRSKMNRPPMNRPALPPEVSTTDDAESTAPAPTATATVEPEVTTRVETAGRSPVAPSPTVAAVGPSLADEVAALDQAREAMKSDDPAQALQRLEAYQRKYKSGTLGQEAAVLRIEALAGAGKKAQARAAAAAFLAQYPASPYAQRVRSVMAATAASKSGPATAASSSGAAPPASSSGATP